MAYDEETLIYAHGGSFHEIYGCDGYGYYTFRDTAEAIGMDTREGKNPLFVRLMKDGKDATRKDVLRAGAFS